MMFWWTKGHLQGLLASDSGISRVVGGREGTFTGGEAWG